MELSNTNSLRIERWMTAIVFGKNAPAGGLRFTLHHASLDEAQRLLQTWDIETIPDRESFRELVAKIDEEAAEDTAHLGWGVQRYVLSVTTQEGRQLGSLTLRYSGNNSPMDGGLDTEPASSRGQVALSMRHTDGAYRLLGAGFGTVLDALNRRLGQQDAMIEKMMLNQTKNFELMADLAEKKFEREIIADSKKKEAELEFYKQVDQIDRRNLTMKLVTEQLSPLLPVIANRLFRRKDDAMATTPREDMLATLFEGMSAEQGQELRRILSPTQLASFIEIVTDLFSAREAAGQQAPTANVGTAPRVPTSWSTPMSVSEPKFGTTSVEKPFVGTTTKNPAQGPTIPQKSIFESGAFRIPNFSGMAHFPDLGAKGPKPPAPDASGHSPAIPRSESSPVPVPEPESAATLLTHEAAAIALVQIKEKLLPWLLARSKTGEPLEPGAFLPKETRVFELFMRSITRAQYDDFMAGGFGFDAEERSVISRLAEAMRVVPVVTTATSAADGPTSGGAGWLPPEPAGGK